ncbi:deoxyribonuclease-2-beta-like [Scomber japonicus]|uniref:deoxyribonuclease-2-beta-like n=1 Tax=Scomber japonicus TaxID=13676 RepID=UPI0023050802|nr:deoxyribonuclease-2-beta-like [Scomber japonicus]
MWRLVLVVSLLCCSSEASVSCRDENGAEVDWFILYKTPRNLKLTGLEYVYIYPDNNQKAKSQRSTKFINAADGLLANTLQPLNLPPPNFGFISYNDGVPEGCSAKVSDPTDTSGGAVSSSFGHSKGVVMVEKDKKGVWLLHSTPQFPYSRDPDHFYPESGTRNAQIFICVTFNYDQFKAIGEHLQKIRAFPFDHHIPSDFHRELQDVTTMNTQNHNTPANNRFPPTFQQLTSSGGKTFHSIAKQVSDQPEDGDLYVSISNEVRSDVNVQSWGCQPERDGSYCPTRGYKVQNVVLVETVGAKWDPGSDHSKWCVAVDQNKPWTCISDVNRSESQYGRLGGALCVKDEDIRNIFMSFVVCKDEC